MGPVDRFALEGEISLSEFRAEKTVSGRLARFHRLRVRRRNDLLGVLLDVGEWQRLVAHVAELEAEAERREDEWVRAIVDARLEEITFERGSDESVAEMNREFERLSAKRSAR